jgi:probable F420-dependent oxidoreductase
MQIGVCVPNTHETLAERATVVEVARRAEALGFDSLWVNDHVVVPSEEVTTGADDRQAQYLDRGTQKILEPLVLLSYLAACTDRIALGTSVFVLALRNPVIAAKQVATLDVLSGGRVVLGVGVGWMEAEFDALGVPWRQRGRRTDAGLKIAKALWQGEPVPEPVDGHELAHVVFNPLPDQRPHPPIWIGGRTEIGARRAARLGDAWHPSHLTLTELMEWRPRLDALCDEAGRSPAEVGLTTRRRVARGARPSEPQPERRTLQGRASDMVEDLEALADVGVDHIILEVDAASAPELYDQIDWLGHEVLRRPLTHRGAITGDPARGAGVDAALD